MKVISFTRVPNATRYGVIVEAITLILAIFGEIIVVVDNLIPSQKRVYHKGASF